MKDKMIAFIVLLVILLIVIAYYIVFSSTVDNEIKASIIGLIGIIIASIIKVTKDIKTRIDSKLISIEDNNCTKILSIESDLNDKFINLDRSIIKTLSDERVFLHDKMGEMLTGVNESIVVLVSKFEVIGEELQKIKHAMQNIEDNKNKKEVWSKEFENEWKGLRGKFDDMRDMKIKNLALGVKEELRFHFMEILSWNLKTSTEEETDNIVKNIIEKIDNVYNNIELLINDYYKGDQEILNFFKEDVLKHIVLYKEEIRSIFKESIINNVYNQYHRLSQNLLNKTLNSVAKMHIDCKRKKGSK